MDTSFKGKTVALVEWHWTGHHATYFKLYCKALLELGVTVVGYCPDPDEVHEYLNAEALGMDQLSRLTLERIDWQRVPKFPHPRRLSHLLSSALFFKGICRKLRLWEQSRQQAVDLVFFACIYDHDFKYFSIGWRWGGRSWAGLYLHCRSFRMPGTVIPINGQKPCPERFLRAAGHHGLALLDEGVRDQATALSGRPTVVFPDLTDPSLRDGDTVLSAKLRRFASGRPVVASLGHLMWTKGCGVLARVAQRPRLQGHVVALVGDLTLHSFPFEDQALLVSFNETAANGFAHFRRVSDGHDFNALFAACDVIYAGYLNFPNSSNILTKCAFFNKPVIVSDGSLMAERVREYRLGEIIPEEDMDAAEAAILRITADTPNWIAAQQPRWDEYQRNHSYEALRSSLEELLRI